MTYRVQADARLSLSGRDGHHPCSYWRLDENGHLRLHLYFRRHGGDG